MFVIEGVLPFLSPDGVRRTLARVASMNDTMLRIAGAASMLAGVAVLWLARG